MPAYRFTVTVSQFPHSKVIVTMDSSPRVKRLLVLAGGVESQRIHDIHRPAKSKIIGLRSQIFYSDYDDVQ